MSSVTDSIRGQYIRALRRYKAKNLNPLEVEVPIVIKYLTE